MYLALDHNVWSCAVNFVGENIVATGRPAVASSPSRYLAEACIGRSAQEPMQFDQHVV